MIKSFETDLLESFENIAKNTFQLEISEEKCLSTYSYQERRNRPVQAT